MTAEMWVVKHRLAHGARASVSPPLSKEASLALLKYYKQHAADPDNYVLEESTGEDSDGGPRMKDS